MSDVARTKEEFILQEDDDDCWFCQRVQPPNKNKQDNTNARASTAFRVSHLCNVQTPHMV